MDGKTDINGLEVRYRTTGEGGQGSQGGEGGQSGEGGQGADIVLLHGWGCDHTIWQGVQAQLEEGFRVTSIDLPGFGESSEPPAAWGVEEYAAHLELFVERMGIRNPILFGHSHGGRVAILYASRNPVRKMVLVDAAGIKPRRSADYYLKVWSFKALKKFAPLLMGRARGEKMIEERRKRSSSADYRAASPVMRATLSKVVNTDLRGVMPLIKAPTLLVWGSEDTATPLRDARIMEKRIPGSGLVVFKGAGHYSFLDRPAQFAAVIESFLAEDKRTNG